MAAHGGTFDLLVAPSSRPPLVIRRRLAPVPVDPEERATEEEFITWVMRNNQPDWSWNGPPLPTTKAPVIALELARDGRLWSAVATPSERLSDGEFPPPQDPTMPVMRHRMPLVYEVFTDSGELLGRVAFPKQTRFMAADSNHVWALVSDDDGLPQVVRFRVEPGFGP